MKKIFPILAILIVSLFLGGCVSEQDLIPKKRGEPEGLWLYLGSERMRTDGSERELLLDEVELDGETYTAKDYKVKNYLYCTDTKTIFFVLTVGESDYLYCYNYAEKWGKQLSGACESGGRHPYAICASGLHYSESYVCFESLQQQETETVTRLFLRDGTPVCEDMMNFQFSRDILYKFEKGEEGNTLTWWKDGDLHTVSTPAWEGNVKGFYDGAFIYHFEYGKSLAVDVDTEEVYSITYEGSYYSDWSYEEEVHNGVFWFITMENKQITDGSSSHWEFCCRLYRFTAAGCELVYTFEQGKIKVFFVDATDEAVYLCFYNNYAGYDHNSRSTYKYYDIASGTLKDGEKPYEEKDKTFTCGEYTFWVGYRHYGLMGGRCYYLYRQHGDTVEIMQYIFDDNQKFFDDICEF